MYENPNTILKKNPDIQWKANERQIVLENYKLTIDKAVKTNVQRLVPYFTHALDDENPEVQKLARLGLKAAKNALNKN